ncbi:hypothetical protein ACFV1U_26580 [Streptomyces microflavus]|uniref:hypothetical protein n=1 Tax=Streptomyces microflavus TaxID=1919 RepID=UPI0036984A00
MQERLTGALAEPNGDGVIEAFGALLPQGEYLPLLLDVKPRLVIPGQEGDYFSGEQVTTWGIDQFWGLPEYPHTPYCRTFETAVDDNAHLYEFIVPMVPPTWNERERVEEYVALMERETVPRRWRFPRWTGASQPSTGERTTSCTGASPTSSSTATTNWKPLPPPTGRCGSSRY